jgi:aerobic-type carbon monoxide dehydrogenase small subunit (CoxS/CutS family)
MKNEIEISMQVNGEPVSMSVPSRMHAADCLRHRVGLTGTHVGCEQGKCGMCTIQVDGQAVKSCLMLAVQLDGTDVRTVESLAVDDQLNALQLAFKRHHALQCGFCTPGMLMLATSLAARGVALSREQIRSEISGVLCRCTGYEGIVLAVEEYLRGQLDRAEAAPALAEAAS